MLGNLLTFGAARLAGRAVDSMERRIVWGGLSGFLMLAALTFGLIAGFIYLQSHYGTMQAALALMLACAVAGLLVSFVPAIITKLENRARANAQANTTAAERLSETVDEQAHEAVDFLGPMQVAISAFMLGLNAGRGVRRKS